MELDLDLTGRRVLIVGGVREARRAIARYLASGADVSLASPTGARAVGIELVDYPRSAAEWADAVSDVDLVVVVEIDAEMDAMVTAACTARRRWVSREPASPVTRIGRVTLVGGGPGDGGLLTLAGRAALRDADVVYYDRLAPHRHLDRWAPGAELVDVGKKPGHHAVPQSRIEQLMVASALAGANVVRLKGGDSFVFGRGGEEVIACREGGVPVTVIPGVTSAIAVPAAAGIPVTHRDVSHLVTIVSGHAPLDERELEHLAGLGGTLVVLMGIMNLPHLVAGLARHGMAPDMPVAIIERGFTPDQRTTIADIESIVPVAGAVGAGSPAVLVIGEVVAQSGQAAVDLAELAHSSSAYSTG